MFRYHLKEFSIFRRFLRAHKINYIVEEDHALKGPTKQAPWMVMYSKTNIGHVHFWAKFLFLEIDFQWSKYGRFSSMREDLGWQIQHQLQCWIERGRRVSQSSFSGTHWRPSDPNAGLRKVRIFQVGWLQGTNLSFAYMAHWHNIHTVLLINHFCRKFLNQSYLHYCNLQAISFGVILDREQKRTPHLENWLMNNLLPVLTTIWKICPSTSETKSSSLATTWHC